MPPLIYLSFNDCQTPEEYAYRYELNQVITLQHVGMQALQERGLECFRLAAKIRLEFDLIRRARLEGHIFTSPQEILQLESEIRENKFDNFIVKCCRLCEHELAIRDQQLYLIPNAQTSWVFDSCQSFWDLARINISLNFPKSSTRLRHVRSTVFCEAVHQMALERKPEPEELLMLFLAAASNCVHELLPVTWRFVFGVFPKIPQAAKNLMLSIISDSLVQSWDGFYDDRFAMGTIWALLRSGASLDYVPKKYRYAVSLLRQRHGYTWLYPELCSFDSGCFDEMTNFSRIVGSRQEWPDVFLRLLNGYTCCSLDYYGKTYEKKLQNIRVPSLQCLAARKTMVTYTLEQIPTFLKSFCATHQFMHSIKGMYLVM